MCLFDQELLFSYANLNIFYSLSYFAFFANITRNIFILLGALYSLKRAQSRDAVAWWLSLETVVVGGLLTIKEQKMPSEVLLFLIFRISTREVKRATYFKWLRAQEALKRQTQDKYVFVNVMLNSSTSQLNEKNPTEKLVVCNPIKSDSQKRS